MQAVIEQLRAILPNDGLLTAKAARRAYECDGLTAHRAIPLLVAMPETVQQIAAILACCCEHKLPVVPRGAGTGLSGGATPRADGLLLSTARLNKILSIDPLARIARVEPGVRNLAVSEAVAEHGLYYAPDPSSQIACSIGGNVAENAGGVHCLKYGLTVHNVLGIKALTMNGQELCLSVDHNGVDMLALFIGSEGLLGVVTEITLKLLPKPQLARAILAAFDDLGVAGETVARIISDGIVPAGLEMMDQAAIHAAEDYLHPGYPLDAAALLICEIDGTASEVSTDCERLTKLLEASGARDIRVSKDETERQRFWAGRKAAFPAVGRISPDYYCMDGTIPRKHLGRVLREIQRMSADYGLAVANVFHAGDGNLHPLILYDANRPGQLEKAEAFGSEILRLSVAVGGSITGEHGVGIEKLNDMCAQFSDAELRQFERVKRAFDVQGLMNPGKAIPTLNRCAEFGAMHVRHGELRFAELERF